jgi:hypothetical protein
MRRALLIVALLASPALAQKAPHREGEYGGVSPSQTAEPSARPAKPKKLPPKGTLTWIGFEAKDGGAQVFLQAVEPFEVTQRVEGSTLVVHLPLTRLGTNTWRHVDTRFFDNPIANIVARAVRASKGRKKRPGQGRGIDVRIMFKNPKDAKEAAVRSAKEPDGLYYVYLSFPEGAEGGAAGASASGGDIER